jgi:hypothetical protein
MTTEIWKDIVSYEGRYQVSNLGRVKSLPFMQRYLLRNGVPALRRVRERIRKLKLINSGYATVSLHLDNVGATKLVHILVAEAFIEGPRDETVNHKDGVKTNNAATNLEWATYTANHLHAVEMGLNKQAQRVVDPSTGIEYGSISQAAKATRHNHRLVSRDWARA